MNDVYILPGSVLGCRRNPDQRAEFRNFSGEMDRFKNTDRYFTIRIDDAELAQDMIKDGFNVGILAARDEGDEPSYILKVKFKMSDRLEMNRIVNNRALLLNEDTVGQLDDDRIDFADLEIRGFEYEPGKMSAWLNGGNFYVQSSSIGLREGVVSE